MAQQRVSTTLSIRKGAIRSRPRSRWTNAVEEIDFARSSSWNPATRDGSQDINSIASVQKITSLLEIFPEVSAEVMEDVLIAAQFRMDLAASMLSEMVREIQAVAQRRDSEWESDSPDLSDEQWFDLNESRPELQQWVVVQDEWELVDDLMMMEDKNPTVTYADVLRTSSPSSQAATQASTVRLPKLTNVTTSTVKAPAETKKWSFDEMSDVSDKSFGSRKRRFMRKYRS